MIIGPRVPLGDIFLVFSSLAKILRLGVTGVVNLAPFLPFLSGVFCEENQVSISYSGLLMTGLL